MQSATQDAPPTVSAVEGIASDVDLLCDFDRVIDFDAEIPHGTFEFRVTQQQLHRAQIACSAIDQHGFVRRSECVPNFAGSRPMLATHS